MFTELRPARIPIQTAGGLVFCEGIGTVYLELHEYTVLLQNVLYLPNLQMNILSTKKLGDDHHIGYSSFEPHCLFEGHIGNILVEVNELMGLPYITTGQPEHLEQLNHVQQGHTQLYYAAYPDRPISLDLAHRRLGHIEKRLAKKLILRHSTGIKLKENDQDDTKICDECMDGKMKVKPYPKRQPTLNRARKPFEMLNMDLFESPELSLEGGYKWLLVIVDQYTRYTWSYGVQHKGDVEAIWVKWKAMISTQHGDLHEIRIKRVRSDNGGEFLSGVLQRMLKEEGIEWQPTVAYAHNQSGVVEKAIGDIVSHAVCVLSDSKLPLSLWYEIARSITYLRRLWPHKFLRGVTPYEKLYGKKPDISHLRVIGSKAWVLIPKPSRGGKLQPKAARCRLLGSVGTNQYKLWDPELNRVIYARDVDFDEWDAVHQEIKTSQRENPDDDSLWLVSGMKDTLGDKELTEVDLNGKTTIEGAVDGKTTTTSNDERTTETSAHQVQSGGRVLGSEAFVDINKVIDQLTGDDDVEKDDQPLDGTYFEPSTQNITRGDTRPKRNAILSRKARENLLSLDELPEEDPSRFTTPGMVKDAYLNTMTTGSTYSLLEPPQTFEEAMQRPDALMWRAAIQKELQALIRNGTWENTHLKDVPQGHTVLSGRWVFLIKRNGTYKARWVIRGFEQVEGIDYQETYAAVVRAESYRLLLACAILLGWTIDQLDVVNAFLRGDIDTTIYMEMPPGLNLPSTCVARLKKSLYGLKQAPRLWARKLYAVLKKQGFKRLESEHAVFVRPDAYGNPEIIISAHVDDLLFIAKTTDIANDFKEQFKREMDVKEVENVEDYLGIEIEYDKQAQTIKLSQKKYLQRVLKRFGMENCNSKRQPIAKDHKIQNDNLQPLDEAEKLRYLAIVGSLTYAI